MPTLEVLTGCTAVGKSAWAMRRAEEIGAEILSCDSLLFYRGMDIGTAKPSLADRARVPHHLIDICPVTESMNVARYAALARAAAEDVLSRGRKVLVAGGSGFYLKSFLAPVADSVAVPDSLRRELEARLQTEGLPGLVAQLRSLNPEGLGELDADNPRRVIRGLERCLVSGRTLRELAADLARQPAPFDGWTVEVVRLERTMEDLDRRIAERTDRMLTAGLLDEVRRLREAGLERNPSAARAIGYRESLAVLDGALPERSLAEAIVRNTRALVRKQRTWFRTQLPAHRTMVPEP